MREAIQLDRALQFIENSLLSDKKNTEPLSSILSKHFRSHRNMGSKDRRLFSDLVYSYCRIGNLLPQLSIKERLQISIFLTSSHLDKFGTFLFSDKSNWAKNVGLAFDDKWELLKKEFSNIRLADIFHSENRLSEINTEDWIVSHLSQPDLWIRVREGMQDEVKGECEKKGIHFRVAEDRPNSWSFPNRTRLSDLDTYKNGAFEIQDLSSQRTIEYIQPASGSKWWDACCGAGGKSLMILDHYPEVDLYLSDTRSNILRECKRRLKRTANTVAAIKEWDLLRSNIMPFTEKMDGIVLDVPCSGSGTWGRTPEGLVRRVDLEKFHKTQVAITMNAVNALKVGGVLVYITCSVFYDENEAVIESVLKNSRLELQKSKLLLGSDEGADTLYVAQLQLM